MSFKKITANSDRSPDISFNLHILHYLYYFFIARDYKICLLYVNIEFFLNYMYITRALSLFALLSTFFENPDLC